MPLHKTDAAQENILEDGLLRDGVDYRLPIIVCEDFVRIEHLDDLKGIDVNVKRMRDRNRDRGVGDLPFFNLIQENDFADIAVKQLPINLLVISTRPGWAERQRLGAANFVVADVLEKVGKFWRCGDELAARRFGIDRRSGDSH